MSVTADVSHVEMWPYVSVAVSSPSTNHMPTAYTSSLLSAKLYEVWSRLFFGAPPSAARSAGRSKDGIVETAPSTSSRTSRASRSPKTPPEIVRSARQQHMMR